MLEARAGLPLSDKVTSCGLRLVGIQRFCSKLLLPLCNRRLEFKVHKKSA